MRTMFMLAMVGVAGCKSYELYPHGAMDTAADYGDTDYGDTAVNEEPGADEVLLSPPAALPTAIFVANPDRNTVTRIATLDQDIRTVAVGTRPERLWTSLGLGAAVTLNLGDDSLSLVDGASLSVQDLDIRPNLNTLSLSPSGMHAVVWYDPDLDEHGHDGVQAFNEITVVDLAGRTTTSMSVGFNPQQVGWTPDGYAVVVTDGWIAFVDIFAPQGGPDLLPLADDPDAAPPAREVVISSDGQHLLIRLVGVSQMLAVDREARSVTTVPLPSPATDLEPLDGDRVAVLHPDNHAVGIRSVVDGSSLEAMNWGAEDHGFQAMESTGTHLLLHTPHRARYGWLDPGTGDFVVRSLVKSSTRVALVDGQRLALFEHPATDVEDVEPGSPFQGRHGLSLVELSTGWSNPIRLDAGLEDIVDSGEGYGFFTVDDVEVLAVLDYATLLATAWPMASLP